MKLKGKTALVTGSSRSIGKGIAQALAKEGALVAINYASNHNAADATVKEIEAFGEEAFAVKGNIGSLKDIEQLFADLDIQLQERTGSNSLDILVNNFRKNWNSIRHSWRCSIFSITRS